MRLTQLLPIVSESSPARRRAPNLNMSFSRNAAFHLLRGFHYRECSVQEVTESTLVSLPLRVQIVPPIKLHSQRDQREPKAPHRPQQPTSTTKQRIEPARLQPRQSCILCWRACASAGDVCGRRR